MVRLWVQPSDAAAFESEIAGEEAIIGRSPQADLVVADPFLSRYQARLFRQGDRWLLEDLDSHNGTRLNGVPLAGPQAIHSGDRIELSASVLWVREVPIAESADQLAGLAESSLYPAPDLVAADSLLRESSPGELRRQAEKLRLLNEVHNALCHTRDLDQLLALILRQVCDHLQPEEAAILLEQDGGGFRPAARHRAHERSGDDLISQSLIEEVAGKGQAARVLDRRRDVRFADATSLQDAGVVSLLAAPLLTPEGCLGLIAVHTCARARAYTDQDLGLLTSLAAVAAMRIRQQRLIDEDAERRRLEAELTLARDIQVGLLRSSAPAVPGYAFAACNLPSRGVSGDFYKIAWRGAGEAPDEIFVMVADVSGKGMAAALLTATTEALGAAAIAEGLPPDALCRRVGDLLEERTPDDQFVTAFLVALHPASGRCTWTNAGHPPPLLLRAGGGLEELSDGNLPLGLMRDIPYSARRAELRPGDRLAIFTDGLVEALDRPAGRGLDRLRTLCRPRRPAAELVAGLEQRLCQLPADGLDDDRTLVVIDRWPSTEAR